MKRIIAMLLCMLLLLSVPGAAFADNAEQGLATAESDALENAADGGAAGSAAGSTAASRGLAAIQSTGHTWGIVLPQEESYLEEWKTLYARKAFRAPCLQVESAPKLLSGGTLPWLYEGVEVTVVAEENDMSCILYRGNGNKLYVGWIQSIRLLEEFPGETLASGTAPSGSYDVRDDITVSWSGEGWRTSQQYVFQQYTRLSEEVKDCVGFTLEYQLIAENSYHWDEIYGPREIYVRSGGRWIRAGQFPYPEKGTVKVQVWLEQPMDIDAFGTIARCESPDTFQFRQTATDFAVLKGTGSPVA